MNGQIIIKLILLSVYYQEIKRFSSNFQLSSGYLIQSGKILNRPNLKDIRPKIIYSFIQNTWHLVKRAYNKLYYSQMDTYKVGVEKENYEDIKLKEIAIKSLPEAQEIISYDKIKCSLIFSMKSKEKDLL